MNYKAGTKPMYAEII